MDWKEFASKIIDSLAWPLVVMIAVLLLKGKIGELIPRLKKFRHRDTEIEFSELVNELISESKSIGGVEPTEQKAKENFDFLMKLADISPRSAVIESFRNVENAATVAIVKAYPEIDTQIKRKAMYNFELLRGKVLNDQQFKQLNDLKRIRNKAAHMKEFNLQGMPLGAYVDIALSMANNLENYKIGVNHNS